MFNFPGRGASGLKNAVSIQSPQQIGPAQAMYMPQGLADAFGPQAGAMIPGQSGAGMDENMMALLKMYGGQ